MKNCPFCKSTDVEVHTDEIDFGSEVVGYVSCQDCDARGPTTAIYNIDMLDECIEEATAIWNER